MRPQDRAALAARSISHRYGKDLKGITCGAAKFLALGTARCSAFPTALVIISVGRKAPAAAIVAAVPDELAAIAVSLHLVDEHSITTLGCHTDAIDGLVGVSFGRQISLGGQRTIRDPALDDL